MICIENMGTIIAIVIFINRITNVHIIQISGSACVKYDVIIIVAIVVIIVVNVVSLL